VAEGVQSGVGAAARFSFGPRLRLAVTALAFTAAYCALDRLGSIFSPDGSATPWDLAGGLALGLLILRGPAFAPAVALADLLASILTPGPQPPLPVLVGDAAALAAIYGLAAAVLRRQGLANVATQADLLRLGLAIALAATARAAAVVITFMISRIVGAHELLASFTNQWSGALVGALVLTPGVLMLRSPWTFPRPAQLAEGALVGVLLAAVLFYSLPPRDDDQFRLFYLLFLPQIWVAVRFGRIGAVLGNLAVQSGLIAYLLIGGQAPHMVFNFEARLLALALSTLFLGVAVSERRQTERALRERQDALAQVSRLSLAGEMAGALAHELNQPLLAIMAFTRTAQRLRDDPGARERFEAATDGAVAQAERAGAIIRSLRRFVERSEDERGAHALDTLVRDALALSRPRFERAGVRLQTAIERSLPRAWVDPVQIQQVVLNLVQNAAEAIIAAESAQRVVTVSAGLRGEGGLEVEVRDTGPGVPGDLEPRLFEAFTGEKAGGMGLGLLVSRGIVEGHGGRLWLAENRPGACAFRFTLPPRRARARHG
jgi:signal transduction histidine kinase